MSPQTRRAFTASLLGIVATSLTSGSAQEATPSASPVANGESVWIEDPRDLNSRPWKFEGITIRFLGEVDSLEVAPPDKGYFLRGDEDYDYFFRSWLSVKIPIPDEDYVTVSVMVGFDDDPAGVNEGVVIEVVGALDGEFEGTNGFGADSSWPFIRASSVVIED